MRRFLYSFIPSRNRLGTWSVDRRFRVPLGTHARNSLFPKRRGRLACGAGFPTCEFTGLSSPVFQKWRLESRLNPQTRMSALHLNAWTLYVPRATLDPPPKIETRPNRK